MGTANPKSTIDTHTKRKSNPNTKLNMFIKPQEKKTKEEGKKEDLQNKPKTIKKMVIGIHILIITLNVNGLNVPTKTHRLAEWIQKQDWYICCLQETHQRPRDTYRLKVRGRKKVFHGNGNQKKAGVAIYTSEKIDFKIKTVARDKEGHYTMIKGSIQEEDITIVNIYAPTEDHLNI